MTIDIVEQIAFVRRQLEVMEHVLNHDSQVVATLRAIIATLEKVAAEERPGLLQ